MTSIATANTIEPIHIPSPRQNPSAIIIITKMIMNGAVKRITPKIALIYTPNPSGISSIHTTCGRNIHCDASGGDGKDSISACAYRLLRDLWCGEVLQNDPHAAD